MIMKKNLFFAAMAIVLASCASDDFVGENNNSPNPEKASNAIVFNSGSKAITRADHVGADAASMLSNHFTVGGFKGDGSTRTTVFDNYIVNWAANTAATTESNTSDWEYVGITAALPSGITGAQTIKYWDYSTSQYDFVAYSTGALAATTGDAEAGTSIKVTAIAPANLTTAAYTLTGAARADLAGCYVADMVTAYETNNPSTSDYGKEVTLTFRSLSSKVRMALYETVPGYSVKDVKFYTAAVDPDNLGKTGSPLAATTGTAALIGTMNDAGTYTVSFPTIGSDKKTNSDYNKAHVSFASSSTSAYQQFGTLDAQYTVKESREKTGTKFLGRTSPTATFAGTASPDNFYKVVLPNENGAVFELAIDYTLEATDGSGEEINVYGATAYIPAVYTKWLPNYAYTYIFKISDNTNGWTSTTNTDPKGLFPITFDAVVIDSEENTQTTITTVAEPSITTYQKGHVYSASDEYGIPTAPNATVAADNDAIYAQVMKDGALVTSLSTSNSYFYTISNHGKIYTAEPTGWPTGYYTDAACTTQATGTFSNSTTYYKRITEADVMDALNIRTSGTNTTVTGRNGITLTPATADYTVAQIPGEDGNWITKYWNGSANTAIASGMVAKLSPTTANTYAFVYDYTSGSPAATPVYTAVQLATKPADFTTKYYKKTGPGQDPSSFTLCADEDFVADGYFYQTYEDLNHTYAVKVIKVVE
jgi:hypothetical protein